MKNRPCVDFRSFIDELRHVSSKFYYGFNSQSAFSSIFSASDVKLVRELAANKNLVVTRPDKGNGVVILDKEEYISSKEGIVSDTHKFFSCK